MSTEDQLFKITLGERPIYTEYENLYTTAPKNKKVTTSQRRNLSQTNSPWTAYCNEDFVTI